MKKFYLLLSIMLIGMIGFSQNCESIFPVEKGTFMEMKSYDAKGKLTGTNRQTITDVSRSGDALLIKVQSEELDKKDKVVGTSELEMRCEKGVFYMDMKNFMSQASMEGMKDMEMSFDGTNLEFPANIKPGDELKDANMTINFSSSAMTMMNMTVSITNRKVEAIENITTPAGTFECYKISYDMETKTIIRTSGKAIQWYADNVGAVRTESYSKNGKLIGYTELTEFRK